MTQPVLSCTLSDSSHTSVKSIACYNSVKQAAEERLKEKKRREKEQKRSAASRPAGTPGAPSVGEFERHTKGIGAKLLASMGYQVCLPLWLTRFSTLDHHVLHFAAKFCTSKFRKTHVSTGSHALPQPKCCKEMLSAMTWRSV